MTTGERIKECRKRAGLSATELGRRIGKDRATIYRYESGEIGNMPLDVLKPLAAALDTTPEYLLGWAPAVETDAAHLEEIVERLQADGDFLEAVEALHELPPARLASVLQLLRTFGG